MQTWFTIIGYEVSYIEAFSTFFLLINVYLATKENVWSWLCGMIGISLYGIICYYKGWQSEMWLQVVYFGAAVWGWYNWLRGGEEHSQLKVSALPFKQLPILLMAVLLLSLFWVWISIRAGGNDVWWTSINTAISLVAQYLLIRKVRENWYLWILVDISYVVFFVMNDLLFLALLYGVFIVLCFNGLREWKVAPSSLENRS